MLPIPTRGKGSRKIWRGVEVEYTKEEVLHRGMELYEREIRPEVEPGHEGEFLAVDEDGLSASKRVLAREPEAVVCLLGHAAAYRIGSRFGA